MSEAAIVCAVITAAIELLLMAFAVFCIGFFAGYRREEHKIVKRKNIHYVDTTKQTEEKAEKEWKKFLNYDGSAASDNND